jgi:hypothetical protein
MTDEHNIEVAQMDALGRLGVAIKRIAEKDAEIERLTAEVEAFRGDLAEQCGQTLVARNDNEQLRALLKAASYHVEGEGDVSLLADIRRALERKP